MWNMKALSHTIQKLSPMKKFFASKETDKQTRQKLYTPDLSMHKNGFTKHCNEVKEFVTTVKPLYFESGSFESPGFFELYPKSRQKLHCIAPKIVWLFRVSKIQKFEHEYRSRASDIFLNLIV